MLHATSFKLGRCLCAFFVLTWLRGNSELPRLQQCTPYDLTGTGAASKTDFKQFLDLLSGKTAYPRRGEPHNETEWGMPGWRRVTGWNSKVEEAVHALQANQELEDSHVALLIEIQYKLKTGYTDTAFDGLLRAGLGILEAVLQKIPKEHGSFIEATSALSDCYFLFCAFGGDANLGASERSLQLTLSMERWKLGKQGDSTGLDDCGKIVLLTKRLGRLTESSEYAHACGLDLHDPHQQYSNVPTQPWWDAEDSRLPSWVKKLRKKSTFKKILAELRFCKNVPGGSWAFIAENDWFISAEVKDWAAIEVFSAAKKQCSACAEFTCHLFAEEPSVDYGLWPRVARDFKLTGTPPPLYVKFYSLAPGARLTPHFGMAGKLNALIALEVPPGGKAGLRVGSKSRSFNKTGQMLIFDDAYEHEAWNDGDTVRYVLGVGFWHPSIMASVSASDEL